MSRQEKSIQKQKDCAADGISHDLNAIKSIEDKYGLILFRMGLTHLVDIGVRNFEEEAVQESIEEIKTNSNIANTDGSIPVMTADFQCEIVRCAAELSKFSIWTLFAYIKKNVTVE